MIADQACDRRRPPPHDLPRSSRSSRLSARALAPALERQQRCDPQGDRCCSARPPALPASQKVRDGEIRGVGVDTCFHFGAVLGPDRPGDPQRAESAPPRTIAFAFPPGRSGRALRRRRSHQRVDRRTSARPWNAIVAVEVRRCASWTRDRVRSRADAEPLHPRSAAGVCLAAPLDVTVTVQPDLDLRRVQDQPSLRSSTSKDQSSLAVPTGPLWRC
jgi:hypothetical protein